MPFNSIIDIRKNSQPRKEKNVLVFNGEIYNFRELKKNHLQDTALETNGDTEVLLKCGSNMVQNA